MNHRTYELNEYQLAAVHDDHRTCLVNANVGSGKTTVLIEKIRYYHEENKIAYEDMIVLTFTNRAAGEIRERLGIQELGQMTGIDMPQGDFPENETEKRILFPYLGTFHSVAYKLLREVLPIEELGFTKEFEIILPEEEAELAKEIIVRDKLKIKYQNRLMKRLEQEKKKPKYQDDLPKLRETLILEKKKSNRLSYDDLIDFSTRLLKNHPIPVKAIVVDEIQDSDDAQLDFLEALKGEETFLFAVGDPNQVIYSFRGSDSMVLYSFKTRFAAFELSLPINYRSDATILEAAARFKQGGSRLTGVRDADSKVSVKRHYDPFSEAIYLADKVRELKKAGVPFEEIAIFYRMQNHANVLVSVFEREGVPFYLNQAAEGNQKNKSIEASSDTKESIDKDIVDERNLERLSSNVSTWSQGVRLMTLHASKGLEFSHVFIIGVNDGNIPIKTASFDDGEEERRLFYVGMTRAKDYLELSYYVKPADPRAFGGPGRFIKMLPAGCLEETVEEDKNEHLQNLRKEVAAMVAKKTELQAEVEEEKCNELETTAETEENEKIVADAETESEPASENREEHRKVRHAKYGIGTVISEDDSMITISFENFGEKEFIKAFTALEDIPKFLCTE